MGERFEVELESAWSRFEADLTALLRSLGQRRHRVEVDSVELAGGRYVEFVGREGGPVVALVSGNTNLVSDHRLDKRQHAGLRALGWQRPSPRSNGDWWHESESGMEDYLASMAVTTLRRVLGVVSPEFLATPPAAPDRSEPATDDEGFQMGFPTSAGEAAEMVVRILAEGGQEDVEGPDDDGDIAVMSGDFFCYARPRSDMPVVTLWGVLLHRVTRRQQALAEVNVRNRREPMLRLSLDGGAIIWRCDVPADPLVAGQLRHRIAYVRHRIAEIGTDLDDTVLGVKDHKPRPDSRPA